MGPLANGSDRMGIADAGLDDYRDNLIVLATVNHSAALVGTSLGALLEDIRGITTLILPVAIMAMVGLGLGLTARYRLDLGLWWLIPLVLAGLTIFGWLWRRDRMWTNLAFTVNVARSNAASVPGPAPCGCSTKTRPPTTLTWARFTCARLAPSGTVPPG